MSESKSTFLNAGAEDSQQEAEVGVTLPKSFPHDKHTNVALPTAICVLLNK